MVSLKILDKFKFIYEKLGVDYNIMRIILQAKLTMDSRKTSNLVENTSDDLNTNQSKKVLMMYAFIGFFMAFTIAFSMNIMLQMTMYFTMIMVLILTTFMSDFSSVILDVKDKGILGTKGISSKTISAAKITHVMIYIINISLALCGFSLIVSIKYGLGFVIIFFVEILLIDIFMIILSGLFYLLVLKLFDGEKLKDMISAIQIGLTMMFSFSYYIINGILSTIDYTKEVSLGILSYFLPPMWFAAPLYIENTGIVNTNLIILSLLAIIVPIISLVVYIKLSPQFEKYLQKLNNSGQAKKASKEKLSFKISKIICKNKEERVFYSFSTNIIKNEREFKARIYPSIGTCLIFPIIIAVGNGTEMNGYSFLSLYFAVMILPTIVSGLKFSKNYKAAYIYKTAPIKDESNIHKGVIKACLVNLIIPVILIQSIIFIIIYKDNIILDLIVVLLSTILLSIMIFILSPKVLPFSQEFMNTKDESQIIMFLQITVLEVVVGFVHYFMYTKGFIATSLYAVILLIVNLVLWNNAFKMKK